MIASGEEYCPEIGSNARVWKNGNQNDDVELYSSHHPSSFNNYIMYRLMATDFPLPIFLPIVITMVGDVRSVGGR